jgi:hypothetical protein
MPARSASDDADAFSEALITGREPQRDGRDGQRDEQGRFLPKNTEKPVEKKAGTEKAAAPAAAPEPEPKAGTSRRGNPKPYQDADGSFVIAGKRFNNLEQVQQILTSKAAEASTASKRAAELEASYNKLRGDYIAAVDVANQWAQAKGAGEGQHQGQPQPAATAPAADTAPVDHFDPKTFRVLLEKHGVDEAMRYQSLMLSKNYEAREAALKVRFDQTLQEKLQPVEEYTSRMRNLQAAAAYLQQAATKYPQLADPQVRAAVLPIWRGLGQDMMFDADLRGIDYAVLKATNSAGNDTQRADDSGLGILSGLGLDDVPFTMEGDAAGDLPRPGEGGARQAEADLSEQLIGHSAGTGGMDSDASFMPRP